MKILVAAVIVLAVGGAAVLVPRTDGTPRAGRTYFVSPAGNDAWPGTRTRPWHSVARVNRAALGAGDKVLFAGGSTYAGELSPPRSGLSFASYGTGRANLRDGIWFAARDDLVFRNLAVDAGPSSDISAIESSSHGRGSTHITIVDCALTHVRVGINSANTGDADWSVSGTLVRFTRDSGVIVIGHDMTFARDTILDTGRDPAITYPKHGVYAKGPSLTFDHVTIERFSADGISLRYRNASVVHSTIAGGPIGIAWFQEDGRAGTTTIAHDAITDTTDSGIYVSPSDAAGPTRESFMIADNTVVPAQGNATDLNKTTGSLTLSDNAFTGPVRTP